MELIRYRSIKTLNVHYLIMKRVHVVDHCIFFINISAIMSDNGDSMVWPSAVHIFYSRMKDNFVQDKFLKDKLNYVFIFLPSFPYVFRLFGDICVVSLTSALVDSSEMSNEVNI